MTAWQPVTPVTGKVLTLHPIEQTRVQPNSESLIKCKLTIANPLLCGKGGTQPDLVIDNTVLIVKPTTVYHQSDDAYYVSIVNPTSHASQELAHARVANKKLINRKQKTPDALKFLPGNMLDMLLVREDTKERHEVDQVAGIQVLCPQLLTANQSKYMM